VAADSHCCRSLGACDHNGRCGAAERSFAPCVVNGHNACAYADTDLCLNADHDAKTGVDADPDAETGVDADPDTETGFDADPDAYPNTESNAGSDPDAKADTDTDAKADAAAAAKADTDTDAKADTGPDTYSAGYRGCEQCRHIAEKYQV